ncbi:MAG: DUF4830 domain-containing protein [Oscillospiraceae bacterium]|nr:DUF4830 domain-containing protein [Oscillospiraceae bacterium]
MFVITVNRKKITKIALTAVCIVAVGAAGVGLKNFFEQDSATVASGKKTKLTTTQEMVDYIAEKGFTADMQTAQVAEVQVPKKFDDSFNAFNEKIKQNDGLSLEKYKGDKVNKWTFDIVGYSEDDTKAVAVLLIRKEKLIGAYILEKPDGIAKPMVKQNQDAGLEQTSADGEYAAEAEKQTSVTELTAADGMPTE